MRIEPLALAGSALVRNEICSDLRGSFSRLFCCAKLQPLIDNRTVVQINRSITRRIGAVRGLHYQVAPFSEMKLIRCLRGSVMDIAVDLRQSSPTFLQHQAVLLSASDVCMVVLPEGIAHGFQALESDSELLYLHTAPYSAEHERGLRLDDPRLGIAWPLAPVDLSDRDQAHPLIGADFSGICF